MRWRTKARIQTIVGALPKRLSYALYYWIQRSVGSLRRVDPISHLNAGLCIVKLINDHAKESIGKTFLEIGTGRRLNIPISLWLLGAHKVITVDLNPYLKLELIRKDLEYIQRNRNHILSLFSGFDCFDLRRFRKLEAFDTKTTCLYEILHMCNIDYVAPSNACALEMQDKSIDYHVSNTVLEHIPPNILHDIFIEGCRVVKDDGLFLHRVDYSDHFSHNDKSISPLNFLQFDDEEWEKLAGNRFMYMNRLRVDDFERLLERSGHEIIQHISDVNREMLMMLETSTAFQLDPKFGSKPISVLSVTGSWFVTRADRGSII